MSEMNHMYSFSIAERTLDYLVGEYETFQAYNITPSCLFDLFQILIRIIIYRITFSYFITAHQNTVFSRARNSVCLPCHCIIH